MSDEQSAGSGTAHGLGDKIKQAAKAVTGQDEEIGTSASVGDQEGGNRAGAGGEDGGGEPDTRTDA